MSSYKRPELLLSTLQTIARQEFQHYEVIVSDNDPAGSARAAVEAMQDGRFRYFQNEENLGMIKSFNKSIERSCGEYIVMLADDDPVYPGMLSTLHRLYTEYPGYGVYHGACDVIYETEEMALSCGGKVGVNSCLATGIPGGGVRTYSAKEFPLAFFNNRVTNYLLWSVCAVKRDILIDLGGIPDYGTPFMGDLAYTALVCSHEGMVFINTSLGAQAVHGANYGYVQNDQFAGYYQTAPGFHEWVSARLSHRDDWPAVKPAMEKFIARWMVGYGVSLRKHLKEKGLPLDGLNDVLKRIFRIPYIRKWRWKYYISAYLPGLFRVLIKIKKLIS